MTEQEVYHLWLGIPPEEQPPNHYRLLGVALFEQNEEVIRNAADRQMAHVKSLGVKQFTDVGQRLLNQIATAQICLLRPEKRAAYEKELRQQLEARGTLNRPSMSVRADRSVPSVAGFSSRLSHSSTSDSLAQASLKLTVGSRPGCDFVVARSTVSRLHCHLLLKDGETYIKDLKSTNGTFVNGKRVHGAVKISVIDWITLGKGTRFIPPAEIFSAEELASRVFFIGRHPECEICRDDSCVSQIHARIVCRGDSMTVEDLGSTNGTNLEFSDGREVALTPNRPLEAKKCVAIWMGSFRLDRNELPSF